MARTRVVGLLVLSLLAILVGAGVPARAQAPEPFDVVVTSTGDGDAGACPSADACTLRAAIALVNGHEGEGPSAIRFAPAVFGGNSLAIIVVDAPLPAIERQDVSILADTGSVVLDGTRLEDGTNGLVITGAGVRVDGLGVRGFGGSCIVADGPNARLSRIAADGCTTGIALHGANASVTQSRIGLDSRGGEPTMTVGIAVRAGGATIGSQVPSPGEGNVIGNVATAIAVGDAGAAFSGVAIAGNWIGGDGTVAARVAIGVQIRPPASAVEVRDNDIANTTLAAIQVVGGDVPPVANVFRGNRFAVSTGMAIDLGADGIRNPNESSGSGPNLMQGHPLITRPTQASISGEVPGCGAGCVVELYRVAHVPGGNDDRPTVPVATTTTDDASLFAFDAPPLTPGQWIMATATDPDGNTSEFSPSVRVGTGVVQCGNVTLRRGWNLVGYFGAGPLPLNDVFPGAQGSRVQAVYELQNGTESYSHWLAGTGVGRTLTTLSPGESYWFLAEGNVTLPDGFSLGMGLPVTLLEGWNTFVYIGGSGDAMDALAGIAGRYSTVYRWHNDGTVAGWESFAPDAPGYANDFEEIAACQSYLVLMDDAGVLAPLQP